MDSQLEWREYYRTRMPYTSALLNIEACKRYQLILGIPFSKLIVWADSNKMCWMAFDSELEQLFHRIMETSLEEIQKQCHAMDSAIQTQREFVKNYMHQKNPMTLPELKRLLQQNLKFGYVTAGKMFMIIDAFDIFSEIQIKQAIRKRMRSSPEKEIEKVFNQLAVPDYTTYAIAEEKDLLEAALKLKNKLQTKETILQGLFEKYWWTTLGWERQSIRPLEYFENKVEGLKKTFLVSQLEQRINEIERARTDALARRSQIIETYQLHALDPILRLMDAFAQYHDVRKEGQMVANWINYQVIDALSKKTSIDVALLDNASFDELSMLCSGKAVSVSTLKQRAETYYHELDGEREVMYAGQTAQKRIDSLKIHSANVTDFGGTIASKGKVTGKAKICFGAMDALKKIHEGDILVTGMTTPDFVPAMRKAAAIITDEGGTTCHAAIISRELKIPCIVGTKIGTKVLKDNDWIEVNANHGKIKKLS